MLRIKGEILNESHVLSNVLRMSLYIVLDYTTRNVYTSDKGESAGILLIFHSIIHNYFLINRYKFNSSIFFFK